MARAARERNAAAERLVAQPDRARRAALRRDARASASLRSAPSAHEEPGRPPVAAAAQPRRRRRRAADGGGRARGDGRARQPARRGRRGHRRARCSTRCWARCSAGVTPFARELGSLGTGDLTVLAEIGSALGGEGECWVGDDVVPAARGARRARARAGPLRPARRHRLHELERGQHRPGRARLPRRDAGCWTPRSAVAALSYEAAGADLAVLDPRVHAARPHHGPGRGRAAAARAARRLEPRERAAGRAIHDAFVFRCVPQVEGTLLDALERLAGVLAIELNVAGENALMLPARRRRAAERQLPRRRADARARLAARRDGAVGLARGRAGQRAARPRGDRPRAAARAGPGPRLRAR